MQREDIEHLRQKVPCAAILEEAAFVIDPKESTRGATKYRRGDGIIIVIHQGRGWFDPLSDKKGDVFALASYLHQCDFCQALQRVGKLVSFQPAHMTWSSQSSVPRRFAPLGERWERRRRLCPSSPSWFYLSQVRRIPASILQAAINHDVVREGPRGSMCAKHLDRQCRITGWEERGPDWRSFSAGGSKALFRLGNQRGLRMCITEAAIDALSLAALENMRSDTLYVSTAGGWSQGTVADIEHAAKVGGMIFVAATDANPQGEAFADRIRQIATSLDCGYARLRPRVDDWNDVLRRRHG
ncbi:DUF3991 and TOPRIM domain-containing protein [Phyllobacterium endophyticum]|uniref:DUF3991 and TOPRIM domain-containing protein n=1 Tax=Phyllobacterium endophyticum TaxID=1149773 RepID=UPI0011CC250E|nr:DUF3991 and TOPRIM domain-containing protein [Phyllobacterium endophyticum]TXR49495.1 DUF3991 domain-containing protein [Phyllobacterium endophyticum]